MQNILQTYKHRYKNIAIRTLDGPNKVFTLKVGIFDIVLNVIGEKAIIFKDDNDVPYHVSFSTHTLDVLTEVFITTKKVNDTIIVDKILVIENDNSHEAMILSKIPNSTIHLKMLPIKDSNGDITTYLPIGYKYESSDILYAQDVSCVISINGVIYPKDNETIDIRYNTTTNDIAVLRKGGVKNDYAS